jgi:cyclopropane fatty-acyl-phospholipid synthase-like methyltransferase
VSNDWYETFFRGIAVEVWRRALSPEQTRADVEFLTRSLDLAPGHRILDVPCGPGRHSIELAARGCRVSGIDLSQESVDAARADAAARGFQIDFRHGDMRELPWTAEFDGAFCFGNSFGYLDPAGTERFVGALARALKPGARCALHTGVAAESVLPNLRPRDETLIDDIRFIEENRYDAWESRVETAYTFVRDGIADTRIAWHWIYTVRQLRALFAAHGLDVTDTFSSTTGEPFRAGAYELYLIARKR